MLDIMIMIIQLITSPLIVVIIPAIVLGTTITAQLGELAVAGVEVEAGVVLAEDLARHQAQGQLQASVELGADKKTKFL